MSRTGERLQTLRELCLCAQPGAVKLGLGGPLEGAEHTLVERQRRRRRRTSFK